MVVTEEWYPSYCSSQTFDIPDTFTMACQRGSTYETTRAEIWAF